MDRKTTQRRIVKRIDWSKIKPLTDDECGHDSHEHRRFFKEQEALAESFDQHLATVDLSHLGSKVEFSYQDSKKLHKLTRQATALKKCVETYIKNHKTNTHSEKLLVSLQHVIRYLNVYHEACRDLPFDWIKRSFLPESKRGYKLSYPDVRSADEEPDVIYVQSDDDDCESVDESETVEGPLEDTGISRHELDRDIYMYLLMGGDEMRRGRGIYHYSDFGEKQIWLEFFESKKFDKETGKAEESLEVDHPIVSVVGNFSVAAFNDACLGEGDYKNLHDFEFMECKYYKVRWYYFFYMTIEAIEKGNSSTYVAGVAYDRFNDVKILCKFVRTDYKPCGTKAMALSYLSCLESICEAMDDLYKKKLGRLYELSRSLKDPARLTALSEVYRLKDLQAKVCEVLRSKLVPHTLFHFPPDRNQTTNPGVLTDVDCCSGMVPRPRGSGYDYYNPKLNKPVDLKAKEANPWKVILWE